MCGRFYLDTMHADRANLIMRYLSIRWSDSESGNSVATVKILRSFLWYAMNELIHTIQEQIDACDARTKWYMWCENDFFFWVQGWSLQSSSLIKSWVQNWVSTCVCVCACACACGWLCTLYDEFLWLHESSSLAMSALDLVAWVCAWGDCCRCIFVSYCVYCHRSVIVMIHVTKWSRFPRVCVTYFEGLWLILARARWHTPYT